MDEIGDPYYRRDLALIHHQGFGFHAEKCAPGLLDLLRPIREREGLVLELGCGSGLLTKRLVDAGHRVVATDASPAMLDLAREYAAGAEDVRQLVLPDDPLPRADAIVSIGHVLSYLSDEDAIDRALVAIAGAVLPGGLFVLDICDLAYSENRTQNETVGWVRDDWALVTRFSTPSPDRFVRDMTTFVRDDDGSWHRDDERHVNVLVDTSRVPTLLEDTGLEITIGSSFGPEELPAGLHVVVGRRPA